MTSRNIGNYNIIEELGRGSLGTLYRAQHSDLDRDVVIREILLAPYPVSVRVQLKARFRRELFVQAQLNHPGITRVFQSFVKGDRYYIVSEYVPGMSLEELLSRQGLPTPGQALYVCKLALSALDYAHNLRYLDESDKQYQGVYHRDIKPSNLIIDAQGKLKITDFGMVRMPDNQTLAPPSFQPGTLEFMPPEQLRGTGLDARSDIYSLGMTFYQVLTGKLPGSVIAETWSSQDEPVGLDPHPPQISDLRSDVNSELSNIFARAIAKTPGNRFQTAAEFLSAIREYEKNNNQVESPTKPLVAGKLRNDVESSSIKELPPAIHTQPQGQGSRDVISIRKQSRGNLAVWMSAAALVLITVFTGLYLFLLKDGETLKALPINGQSAANDISTGSVVTNSEPEPDVETKNQAAGRLNQAREADRLGQFNQAISLYEDYLNTVPQDAESVAVSQQLDRLKKFVSYLNAGRAAFNRQDYSSARRSYSEALKLRPYSRLVQRQIAECDARLSAGTESSSNSPELSSRPRRTTQVSD